MGHKEKPEIGLTITDSKFKRAVKATSTDSKADVLQRLSKETMIIKRQILR